MILSDSTPSDSVCDGDQAVRSQQKTTLFQLELDYRNINCGMSYVIQMRNGEFFLIDGGYFTDGEEERLYRFLSARAPDGDIRIAGWFFSHAHQDHIGNFINFISRYRESVTIGCFLYRIQPVDYSCIRGDWKSCDEATVREFHRILDGYVPDVPRKILKTGDRFSFHELEFEVLFTYPDLRSGGATFNDHSTILRMTIEGQRILWLGDIGTAGSRSLLRLPEEKLRCDIVQVAHHGYNGASLELYRKLNASVALWPTPSYSMSANANSPVNDFLLNGSGIREHIVGGEGTVEMTLPYVPCTGRRELPQFVS